MVEHSLLNQPIGASTTIFPRIYPHASICPRRRRKRREPSCIRKPSTTETSAVPHAESRWCIRQSQEVSAQDRRKYRTLSAEVSARFPGGTTPYALPGCQSHGLPRPRSFRSRKGVAEIHSSSYAALKEGGSHPAPIAMHL